MNKKRLAMLLAVAMVVPGAAVGAEGERCTAPGMDEPVCLYERHCLMCHGPRGWATRSLSIRVGDDNADLTRRSTLPAAFVRSVVRFGVGSMPPLTPTEITDAELQALAEWLDPES